MKNEEYFEWINFRTDSFSQIKNLDFSHGLNFAFRLIFEFSRAIYFREKGLLY